MSITYKASTHGICAWEMRDCQRLAHLDTHDEPPLWMVYYWMTVQFVLMIVLIADYFVPLFCMLYCMLCVSLILGTLFALHDFFRQQRIATAVWKLQLLYGPQTGELSEKGIRREMFTKRVLSDKKERTRRNPHPSGKKVKKKIRSRKGDYIPQLGSTAITTAFAKLANVRGIDLNDDVLNRIENLGALLLACKDCTTVTGFLSTVFLYLKTHYSKSVANTVAHYLSSTLDAEFVEQTGEFGVSKGKEKPKWLLLLKDVQENWTLVVRNEGFKKISHVMSLCLALGLCDASSLDFKVGGMKVFSIGAFAKQASAVDLIDAAFETVTYFAEGGYACFERGSLKPLLYGNMENEEFEDAYSKCMRCHEFARCGNLEKFENMTENDYEALLSQCIEKSLSLANSCKGVVEKNILRRKTDVLRQWQATFRQTRVQGGLREAPYSIGIFGGTAVGKSTIANVLMVTTLMHNNYCASDDRIVTLNENDKYMSNFRSYTNGVLVDDIGNTKASFVEKAPTALMIQLVNNVRMYANMAEADMKGKVSVEPKVVIGTKNVKDTCATVYSNEPASITRRDRITLTCTVKPEFAVHGMLNEDLVRKAYPNGTPTIPDFWNITVEKSFPVPNKVMGKAATIGWEILTRSNGVSLKDIGLPELIRWIGQDSKKFYASQREFVKKNNNLDKQLTVCPKCHFPTPDVCICNAEDYQVLHKIDSNCTMGYCTRCDALHTEECENVSQEDDSEMNPLDRLRMKKDVAEDKLKKLVYSQQFGEKIVLALLPKYRRYERITKNLFSYWSDRIEDRTISMVLQRLDWLETSRWLTWTNWVPEDWLNQPFMKNVVWFTHEQELRQRIKRSYANHLLAIFIVCVMSLIYHRYCMFFVLFPMFGMAGVVKFEKKLMYDDIVADNKSMPLVFKMYRDRHVKWITGACLTIAALYAVAQIYKALRVIPSPQGNIAPTGMQEIVERDEETNPWAGVMVSPMPCSNKSKTTTPDQLEKLVQANLCYVELTMKIEGKTKVFECDAFFPKSNVAILPQHMWKADDIKAKFTRHDPSTIGGNFESYLYRKNSINVPGTDLSLVWVPNGGDWKDLTDYLPTQRFSDVPARLTYKRSDGTCYGSKLMMKIGDVTTRAADFFGSYYTLSFNTFEGLCMSPLITETKGPVIGGFHLGGINDDPRGCSGLLLKDELDDAIDKLKKASNVIIAKSSGEIPTKLYDVQFFENTDVHFKSPIRYLPDGTNCKYYGQVTGRASYHSEVEQTIISDHVRDVCGVPQKWGGPKFRKGYPWQASLQFSTKPSCGIEGSLLEKATFDYYTGFMRRLNAIPGLKTKVKPLTRMETVCGIDGLRFIDKMPPSTSIGFPLSGPKSQYLEYLDPKDSETHQCPAILEERFWDHAAEMEESYLNGERSYPIFKACLKDEPTKLTKDKVRVFQGAPVALQLLVRKYYLPIVRTLSMLPLASECAVGINAQGPEWDQLAKHVKKFGEDRILAGDYSKYDLRMPAQVMFSAFRILMDIGKDCGYTDRDISIMEGIATDICYPLMAYNGDLIQHFGSNPSGQNLTVYINSIVNSLLFRCAYYSIVQKEKPEFRDVCALITYGDDAKGSVHKDFPEFNHISVANFLAEHDMKFTMPDKESVPTPYMTDTEADLLKRANVFSEDTGLIMGALDEDSIFKSLHATLKSKALSKEQQSMQNIDGALREWFSHGRDVYEKRRSEMLEIAKRADILHGCTVVHESYDDRLAVWKEKYA